MAYYLIPFVAGAVIGGLAVYLYRDEQLRGNLRQSAGDLSRKVQETAGEVSGKVTKGLGQVREAMPNLGRRAKTTRAEVTPQPRTSARGATGRKGSARAPTRKTRAPGTAEAAPPEKPEET